MSDELARLRADLEVLERYTGDHIDIREAEKVVRLKIARLESEQADPWRKAKEYREWRRTEANHPGFEALLQHYDHLTAENADLRQKYDLANETIKTATGRLNETKGELTAAKIMIADRDDKISALTARVAELEKEKLDWTDAFNTFDPRLDPVRVLATAADVYEAKGHAVSRDICRRDSRYAKPYRLKGAIE